MSRWFTHRSIPDIPWTEWWECWWQYSIRTRAAKCQDWEETLLHSRHSHPHHDCYLNIWLKAYDSFDYCILNETLHWGFVDVHDIRSWNLHIDSNHETIHATDEGYLEDHGFQSAWVSHGNEISSPTKAMTPGSTLHLLKTQMRQQYTSCTKNIITPFNIGESILDNLNMRRFS